MCCDSGGYANAGVMGQPPPAADVLQISVRDRDRCCRSVCVMIGDRADVLML